MKSDVQPDSAFIAAVSPAPWKNWCSAQKTPLPGCHDFVVHVASLHTHHLLFAYICAVAMHLQSDSRLAFVEVEDPALAAKGCFALLHDN